MVKWAFQNELDNLDMANGYGKTEIARRTMPTGHGNSDMASLAGYPAGEARQSWQVGHDNLGMEGRTWQCGHGETDMAGRTCQYRHGRSDMPIQTWQVGHANTDMAGRRHSICLSTSFYFSINIAL